MTTEAENFGVWFSHMIEKSGLNLYIVSLETDISMGALYSWSTGKNLPRMEGLVKICCIFAEKLGKDPGVIILESCQVLKQYEISRSKWKKKQNRGKNV